MKLLLLAALAGCSSESSRSSDGTANVSSARQSIIGGTVDSGDPTVVLIGGGGVWCTGTLIAPKVVLTAAHCISPKVSFVYSGPSYLGDAGSSTGVVKAYRHPDYATNQAVDIGIVILSAPSAATPTAVATTALSASDVGTKVHVVGFGDTASPSEPAFTKVQVDVDISSVTNDAFYTGPAVCSGDSGGPAMLGVGANQVVAGVISGHSIQACGGTAGYVRVDVYAPWIAQQIALAGASPDAGGAEAGDDASGASDGSSDANGGDAAALGESNRDASGAANGETSSHSESTPGASDDVTSSGCAIAPPPRTDAGAFGVVLALLLGGSLIVRAASRAHRGEKDSPTTNDDAVGSPLAFERRDEIRAKRSP